MTTSYDGNDGNDGNAANAGGGGNSTSVSVGWFFADRVNLPLVTEFDTGPNAPVAPTPIGQLPTINPPALPSPQLVRRMVFLARPERLRGNPLANHHHPTSPTTTHGPPSPIISPWIWPTWVLSAPGTGRSSTQGRTFRVKSPAS